MTSAAGIAKNMRGAGNAPALDLHVLLIVLAAAIIGLLILYPLTSLLVASFQGNDPASSGYAGFENWARIFSQGRILDAIANTVTLSITRQAIAIVIGVAVAWLIARTDLPHRGWIEVGFWIALFMPALPVTLGWVFLAGGKSGVLNKFAANMGLTDAVLFNVYSWWGIVFVHVMSATTAVKIFLLVPAFRAMDAALEQAARSAGASIPAILWRIVVPIMMPSILVVLVIGIVRSMQAFEVELILGAPRQIDVYSTLIYRAMTQEPPAPGTASALSILFLMSIVPLVILQQWISARRRYGVLSGRFQNRLFALGALRWPAFAAVLALLFMMTIVPMICVALATFMKIFGMFDIPQPWTLAHWVTAFSSGDVPRALWNSIRLGAMAAVCGMTFFTLIAWLASSRPGWPARTLDFLTWLPALIPGVVLSLGLLNLFTGVKLFRPIYGTMTVLVIAILIATMTVGTQVIRSAIGALGRELSEAAMMAGATRFQAFRRVVLPLVAPSVAVIGLEIFATANAAVGIVSLLSTGDTQPLSIQQLVLLDTGQFEAASVVGLLIMGLTITAALLARAISSRLGAGQGA